MKAILKEEAMEPRQLFPGVPAEWKGPEKLRSVWNLDGSLKRIVGEFQDEKGNSVEVTTFHTKRTWCDRKVIIRRAA